MSRLRGIIICTLAAFIAACNGCGYATNNLLRDDIQSVYVSFFDNSTFRRGLEVPLTRAVVNEIKLRTPLLIAPREQADSELTGELVDVSERSAVKDEDDRVLLRRVTVRVKFQWRDRLTGQAIVPEQVVVESTRVVPALTSGAASGKFDVTVQREATPYDAVFQEAAERVVEKMEKAW